MHRLGAVLLSGGGGEALAPFVQGLHPLIRIRTLPNALWANCGDLCGGSPISSSPTATPTLSRSRRAPSTRH